RLGIGMEHTEHRPAGLRFGARTLFRLTAQEREQNLGFLVAWPQTGHAVKAILSEVGFETVVAIWPPYSVKSIPCAETVWSPPKPGRHGEETVQPTNAPRGAAKVVVG